MGSMEGSGLFVSRGVKNQKWLKLMLHSHSTPKNFKMAWVLPAPNHLIFLSSGFDLLKPPGNKHIYIYTYPVRSDRFPLK